jgi:4-hydroxybenzoate polyprenyltransferase
MPPTSFNDLNDIYIDRVNKNKTKKVVVREYFFEKLVLLLIFALCIIISLVHNL